MGDGVERLSPTFGLIREGAVKDVNLNAGTVTVKLSLAQSDSRPSIEFVVPIPGSWMGPNGEFSGGVPPKGAKVWCVQSEGGRWAAISFAPSTDIFRNRNSANSVGYRQNIMAALSEGRWLTQVKNNIRLLADPDIGIQAGNPRQYIHLDPTPGLYSNTFASQMSFSEAARRIDGIVKRDRTSNSNRNISGSALTSHVYDKALDPIGLDPIAKAGTSVYRNPPFVEQHEIVYEFSGSFGFTNDAAELELYDNTGRFPALSSTFKRTDSRANALSLSLLVPNQLIETIRGTVVDIYGNLIDLNRSILPNGSDALSFRNTEENKSDTFIKLREQTRKSIVYHFEINARKANIKGFDDIKRSIDFPTDYARDRSRFFFDVDKEGQFKWNVPASSEIGNVPLLVRYENFSTLQAIEKDTDPNAFIRNIQNRDIFAEEFGAGSISLTGGEDDPLKGFTAPIDRFTGINVKLGTAFHDIQQTLQTHNIDNVDGENLPVFYHSDNTLNIRTQVPLVGNIVTPSVIVSGTTANAGGRSGTITLDGSLNFSIGANTVDRQSLWLDLAGGAVVNYGRDINNRSYQGRMDGDVFVQIGGTTIGNDSRFSELNNAVRDGALDIRVLQGGNVTIVRIDNKGVRIATPGGVDIVSRGLMRLKSIHNDLILDAKSIYFYGDNAQRGRLVQRKAGQTI